MRTRLAVFATLFTLFASSTFAAYRNSAWIPPWREEALTSLQKNIGAIQESNPVWYLWNADGSIAKAWNAENPTWRAAMTGSEILPTIQNIVGGSFNGTAAATVLGSATSRDAHVNAIVALVNANAFDGIDIDYERVPTASRADFTAFVASLATKLHASGKKLSVTVYAKTSDSQNWNGPGAEDWSVIGGAADTVKIMAYDYHWDSSDAGAIAPLSWLDQVTTYAESVIPARKIVIGLPWYGYDWSAGTTASTVSYASATQIATNNHATITHDASSGEATFTYSGHIVYFQDAAAYKTKTDMLKLKHGGIGGVTAWAAGYEDPNVWSIIGGSSTPVAPAPADFAISGSQSLTVQQGNSTSALYTITPINNFTGSVSASVMSTIGATISPTMPATLIVAPSATTPAGVYPVTVRATSGSITHDLIVNVNVTAAPVTKKHATKH